MQLFQSPLKKQCCAHKIALTQLWHLGKTAPKIFACVSNQCQQATLQSCSICVYTHTYSFLSPVKPRLQQHFLYKAFSKSQMLIFHCLSNIFCTQNIFLKSWKQHILPSFQQHFLLSSLCCLFFSLTFDYAYYLKQSFFPSISPSSIFFFLPLSRSLRIYAGTNIILSNSSLSPAPLVMKLFLTVLWTPWAAMSLPYPQGNTLAKI